MFEQSALARTLSLPPAFWMLSTTKHDLAAQWSVRFQDILEEMIFLLCSSGQDGRYHVFVPHQSAFGFKGLKLSLCLWSRITLTNCSKFQAFFSCWPGWGLAAGMAAELPWWQPKGRWLCQSSCSGMGLEEHTPISGCHGLGRENWK